MSYSIDTNNPLEFKNNIVYIDGNLIVDTAKLPLIGMQSMCHVDENYKQYATKEIDGNLRITDENADEYSSFTSFIVTGDIVSYKSLDDNLPYPFGNMDICADRKKDFYELLNYTDKDLPQLLLQMLYVSVFSMYEYTIIMHVLHAFRYKMKEIDNFFMRKRKNEIEGIKANTPDRIKEFLYIAHIRGKVYVGNSKFMKELLFAILNEQIEYPEALSEGYQIRNSIVHRAGCNLNGYPINLTKADVLDIANVIDHFTSAISDLFRKDEMKHVNSVRAQLGLPPM